MLDFSFIISVYNGEKHLEEALSSVATQKYDGFEVIIRNDGSTDATDEIVRRIMPKIKNITYIAGTENLGLAASLNECARAARGEYLVRMDADDVCHTDRLSRQFDTIADTGADAVGGCALLIDEEGSIWGARRPCLGAVTIEDAYKATPMIHPTAAIRREAFQAVKGYTVSRLTRRLEDYDLWLKLLTNGFTLYNADTILIRYRESNESIKRRRFTFRTDAVKLRRQWRERLSLPCKYLAYTYRPLLAGITPKPLRMARAKRIAKKAMETL